RLRVPLAQRRERLVPGDGQEPSADRGAPLEAACLPPHVEKYLADQILRQAFIADEPKHEPVDANVMPREQEVNRELVAGRDPPDQRLVRCRLHPAAHFGRGKRRSGSNAARQLYQSPVAIRLNHILPPPPEGGRSASVARREPGGGEAESPHPARDAWLCS